MSTLEVLIIVIIIVAVTALVITTGALSRFSDAITGGDDSTHTAEYREYKSKQMPTGSVQNGGLVQMVMRRGSPEDKYRLSQLLAKFMRGERGSDYYREVCRVLSGGDLSDEAILSRIPRKEGSGTWRDEAHAKKLYDMVVGETDLQRQSEAPRYLDYGCGDGGTAVLLTQLLGCPEANGVDVKSWVTGFERHKDLKFQIIESDGKIPFPDNSFDLVTANMVLHHVRDVDTAVKEIARVLRPGGYFIIREHDNYGGIDNAIADIEHMCWNAVHGQSLDEFRKTYYSKYHDHLEWDDILAKESFEPKHLRYDHHGYAMKISPTRYYYCVYRRGDGGVSPLD